MFFGYKILLNGLEKLQWLIGERDGIMKLKDLKLECILKKIIWCDPYCISFAAFNEIATKEEVLVCLGLYKVYILVYS